MAFRTKSKDRETKRLRRHNRIRRTVTGTSTRPRLVVHRSLKNMQGHLTDDVAGKVLLGVSTIAPELGEHSVEILQSLGYDAASIEQLIARKVVRAPTAAD